MIFQRITRKEILTYFNSHGYDAFSDGEIVRIYSNEKKDFIILKSKRKYFRIYLYVMLFLYSKQLTLPFSIEWYRFLFMVAVFRTNSPNVNPKNK